MRPLLHSEKDGMLIKFKKITSTFIMLAMVLVLSQSAFAAKGIGDTKESAIDLFPKKQVTCILKTARTRIGSNGRMTRQK